MTTREQFCHTQRKQFCHTQRLAKVAARAIAHASKRIRYRLPAQAALRRSQRLIDAYAEAWREFERAEAATC